MHDEELRHGPRWVALSEPGDRRIPTHAVFVPAPEERLRDGPAGALISGVRGPGQHEARHGSVAADAVGVAAPEERLHEPGADALAIPAPELARFLDAHRVAEAGRVAPEVVRADRPEAPEPGPHREQALVVGPSGPAGVRQPELSLPIRQRVGRCRREGLRRRGPVQAEVVGRKRRDGAPEPALDRRGALAVTNLVRAPGGAARGQVQDLRQQVPCGGPRLAVEHRGWVLPERSARHRDEPPVGRDPGGVRSDPGTVGGQACHGIGLTNRSEQRRPASVRR